MTDYTKKRGPEVRIKYRSGGMTYFAAAWAIAATLLAVAMYQGDLMPRSCVASLMASGANQDYVTALTQFDAPKPVLLRH